MTATTYADPATGEIADVKTEATESACRLLDQIWAEIAEQYPVGPLASLNIAHKVAVAVLNGALTEHKDILAEPLKARQMRLEIGS